MTIRRAIFQRRTADTPGMTPAKLRTIVRCTPGNTRKQKRVNVSAAARLTGSGHRFTHSRMTKRWEKTAVIIQPDPSPERARGRSIYFQQIYAFAYANDETRHLSHHQAHQTT